ncbi:YbgA family protein [Balneatrix alpica]|uniref:YbgA family protein n=1 Tax=Balneatrix alpica TaxID=75684 RepID=UPI00273962C6|nr:DUF523 and DUF1722 domain-containing protein [Balneatrix alpica]
MSNSRPLIGISACLLGQEVRFNGGHKQSRFCLEQLSEHFDWLPACPEVAIGMGVPRQAIRLIGDPQAPRAVGSNDASMDVTAPLQEFSHDYVQRQGNRLSGYILMKNSPSCGMERVKVYQPNGHPHQDGGRGLFAAELMRAFPLLPVEEEGRLQDPQLCDNFMMRVFIYHEWQQLRQARDEANPWSKAAWLDFHSRHKYLLMAHNPEAYKQLGKRLANLKGPEWDQHADEYFSDLMHALARPAERSGHVNVMQHLLGYLKKHTDADSRADLLECIEDYRQGQVPLAVPMRLLRHHFHRSQQRYVLQQKYLQPHPQQLGLRNRLY